MNLGLGLINSGTVTARGHDVFGAFNRNPDVVIEQSGDDGLTWHVVDVLPGAFVFRMTTHGTDLYAGRSDGLWVRSTATLSASDAGSRPGLHFALAGPQPVVGAVRVRFELPEAGRAKIEVFDVTGRRVSEPVQESLSAGAHEVSWDARDMNPGIYAARLTVAQRQETLRLVRPHPRHAEEASSLPAQDVRRQAQRSPIARLRLDVRRIVHVDIHDRVAAHLSRRLDRALGELARVRVGAVGHHLDAPEQLVRAIDRPTTLVHVDR